MRRFKDDKIKGITMNLEKALHQHGRICKLLDDMPTSSERITFLHGFWDTPYFWEAERLLGEIEKVETQIRYLRDTIYTKALSMKEN
jgi:hypothetical protein